MAPKDALTLANMTGAAAFQTHSAVLTGHYVTVWSTVLAVLNKQKDKPVQLDKEKGVIVTDITRHGWLSPSYDKYAIVLEQLDADSTRMTYKVLRYKRNFKADETQRDGDRLKPPAYNARHDLAFEKAVRKRLEVRTD
jgi:hypothetical protein